MRILKNKKRAVFVITMVLIGIIIITELNNEQSEDKQLSSGYSVLLKNLDEIDNNANILNYRYVSKTKSRKDGGIYHLKDLIFSFWDGEFICDEQCPQGICLTEEYLFVTSYADGQDVLGECRVFDKITGEHLITLGMDKKSHLGGVAYDGENIWVCNSAKKKIERISYAFVQHLIINKKGEFVDITDIMKGYRVENIPSSIFYSEGKLYVSTHKKVGNSKMISYRYDKNNDRIVRNNTYNIPEKVQGMTLDDEGRVYISTSYGRNNSSYLKIYSSIYDMHTNINQYMQMIEMPPCSEGIVWENERIYVLFESAGKKFIEGTDGKGKSTAPLDRILIIDLALP